MSSQYPMEKKIKRPKEYTSSVNTNVRETIKRFMPLHQVKSPVKVHLVYPIKVS